MAEDKQQQQPVASEPQKAPKYEKDGDVKMTGMDNEDPIKGELIKIYHFSIDKLSEDNARYWFHTIENRLVNESSRVSSWGGPTRPGGL